MADESKADSERAPPPPVATLMVHGASGVDLDDPTEVCSNGETTTAGAFRRMVDGELAKRGIIVERVGSPDVWGIATSSNPASDTNDPGSVETRWPFIRHVRDYSKNRLIQIVLLRPSGPGTTLDEAVPGAIRSAYRTLKDKIRERGSTYDAWRDTTVSYRDHLASEDADSSWLAAIVAAEAVEGQGSEELMATAEWQRQALLAAIDGGVEAVAAVLADDRALLTMDDIKYPLSKAAQRRMAAARSLAFAASGDADRSPAHKAAALPAADVLNALLAAHPAAADTSTVGISFGYTALHAAAAAGSAACCESILSRHSAAAGPDLTKLAVNAFCGRGGATESTPLHLAVAGGHTDAARVLARYGADWSLTNDAGRGALDGASAEVVAALEAVKAEQAAAEAEAKAKAAGRVDDLAAIVAAIGAKVGWSESRCAGKMKSLEMIRVTSAADLSKMVDSDLMNLHLRDAGRKRFDTKEMEAFAAWRAEWLSQGGKEYGEE